MTDFSNKIRETMKCYDVLICRNYPQVPLSYQHRLLFKGEDIIPLIRQVICQQKRGEQNEKNDKAIITCPASVRLRDSWTA